MSKMQEIIMAGTGGQGLVLMSTLLAQAAMSENFNVTQTQSYGVAQRGGFISTELLAGKEEILFQEVRKPTFIMALHGVVGTRYDASDAPVVYDSTLFSKDLPNWLGIPCTAIANELGVPKAANLVALGAMLALNPFMGMGSLENVIKTKFRGEVAEKNIAAIRAGNAAALRTAN
ncbi:2-oxoacid:acceptor oxidoreductase family protein [Desulfovibrio sp. 86]|uniref:Putative 2-oxoglutarate synthase subunit KorC n=1 Tax=uncultured Desulfovibrio sp. TaxID=167968 RepID=A0A212LAQ0_9BACT|nr:2-oxoacid:acceptor oxidoreductase family protein [Desulfovibrio sp. 86]SCM74399.1 putative 2-oxoglutarate synthase subunit KorC [uncultured Desulfovibrio sp.]VZH34811.1 putative 2-oxoglutarate synthase subunit KorC [Desulfovibrio sp. 86]